MAGKTVTGHGMRETGETANQVIGRLLVEAAKRIGSGEWGCE